MGSYVFSHCTSLTSVTLPSKLKELPQFIFYECESLKNLALPSTLQVINHGALQGTGLTEINIPETVTRIGDRAFMDCVALTKVNIPSKLNSLYEEAFSGCVSLSSVDFGSSSSLRTIQNSCFYRCSALHSLSLPESVEEIHDNTFNSSGLETIIIPKNVTSIGESCFANCKRASVVKAYPIIPPSTGKDVFSNVDLSGVTLMVPSSSIDQYKKNDTWKDFKNITSL